MKLKEFIDNFTATSLAVIVHVVLLGVLVLSLDWSSTSAPAGSKVEPVKAMVVDESLVAEEIEQIKEARGEEAQARGKAHESSRTGRSEGARAAQRRGESG